MTPGQSAALLLLGGAFAPGIAWAAAPDAPLPPQPVLDRPLLNPFHLPPPQRVIGIAEVNLGWLALPGASVCTESGCTQGDSTPLLEVWNLVRPHEHFAVGGGFTLGLFPTTRTPIIDPTGIDRRHTRAYLTLEGIGRYYPLLAESVFQFWIGPGLGLLIVSDTFASADAQSGDAYVGAPGITLRTEGLSVFGAGGLSWSLTKHFQLGGAARVGAWQLPDDPQLSPFGDSVALRGGNFFFFAGLSAALRAEL